MNPNLQQRDRLAVLIDAENSRADRIDTLLSEIARLGNASIKRIYGDWTTPQLGRWKDKLNRHAIQPIQQFRYTTGKNCSDGALMIDAMDLLHAHLLDGFCLVTSDSDFTRLACRIRESGLVVYGFGEAKTPEPFVRSCDHFFFIEGYEPILLTDTPAPEKTTPTAGSVLAQNGELVGLVRAAYRDSAQAGGWVHLATLGNAIARRLPTFSVKAYGHATLGQLVETLGVFEVQKMPGEKNPSVRVWSVRLSAPTSTTVPQPSAVGSEPLTPLNWFPEATLQT